MSKWFERDPQLLVREMRQLASNSAYEELEQERGELFVSAGNFLVRVNGEEKRYPAVIIYPEATPYALPRVFLLQAALQQPEIATLSRMSEVSVPEFLAPKAVLHSRRHQNGDGSLCLLEQDNVDRDGAEEFDAATVLKRVRQWLAGLTTGSFPPEGGEVELASHYPRRRSVHVLLTDDFYRPQVVMGTFYLRPAAKPDGQTTTHFMGACLLGQQASGLYLENVDDELRFMPDGLNTRAALALHADRLAHAVSSKALTEGLWWQLPAEPPVYASPAALVEAMGDGDVERGAAKLTPALWPYLKRGDEEILIGLRFPNRRTELEWLVLALIRKRQDHSPMVGSEPDLLNALQDYELEALFSEPFTEDAYYLRNKGRVDQAKMRQQTVTLLGCGALGSEVADCLGKAGVANIWLNDNQMLHAHNTVRHLAGLHYLAAPKVVAVREILRDHNWYLNVRPEGANVLQSPLASYFAPTGVGISTMADDNTEGYVNEQAVSAGREVYYARALRGGKAARIFRVRPGRDACFNCLSLHKAAGNPTFPVVPEDELLPTIRNECNNPIRPASAADLKLIAALTSRIVLDQLQGDVESDLNHWVWSTEPELGLGATAELPQALLARSLQPHPECRLCRPLPNQVHVRPAALDFMRHLTLQTPGVETGGVLVGSFGESGEVTIEAASGPGPAATCSATGFDRDVAYCQQFVDDHAAAGRFYVGEWHSHPTVNNSPSSTDLASLAAVARQGNYLTAQPVMVIMSRTGEPACTMHPAGKPHFAVSLVLKPENAP